MKPSSKTPRQRPQDAPQSRQTKAPQPTPTRPPSVAELAAALEVSNRRIGQLKKSGLPTDSLEAALAWRQAQATTSSAEQLRQERVKLVRSQRAKIDLDNRIRNRDVIPIGEVKEGTIRTYTAVKNAFQKFAEDLPPRLSGLEPEGIQQILRDEIHAILSRLSDSTHKLF